MFKAPFSFDGRIRRIEYFLSGIVGGIVTWIAMLLGVGTFILAGCVFQISSIVEKDVITTFLNKLNSLLDCNRLPFYRDFTLCS